MNTDKQIRVLLVEDEASDAQLVMIDLKKCAEKFDVLWVESLQQAKYQLQGFGFDVALLDLSLSDSKGLATLQSVRNITEEIPILVLTGYCDTDFALKALEAGATDYVVKGNSGQDNLARAIRYALFRAEMEAKNNLLVAALEAAANSIIITDTEGHITWTNRAFTRLTGYSVEESMGKKPRELISSGLQPSNFYKAMWEQILQGKHWRGELINKRKNGELYHEELSISPVKNKSGEITHFIGIKDDITERKRLEEQLQKLANTDPLTELYNRRVFLEQLTQEAIRIKNYQNLSSAVLMIDLDFFKNINDSYGHSTGDEVLRRFADIMRKNCRSSDLAARLGGEEFAVLLSGADKKEAMVAAERLRQQIAEMVIPHKKGLVRVTISIGAAPLLADDIGGDHVLKCADAALYQAKAKGRNQSCWFKH